jgi:hypothetical protein
VPVYFVYTGEGKLQRVTLKYKGAEMEDWQALELKKVGKGWGGYIPCAAVTEGVLKYWIVGFDPNGGAVAMGGAAKRPYSVPIESGEVSPSHLPDRPAPHKCSAGDSGVPSEPAQQESESSDEGTAASTGSGGSEDKPKVNKEGGSAGVEDTSRKHATLEIATYNDSDHITVFTPSISAGIDNTSGASLSANYLVDVVSAASVDIVSTASQRWQEVRQAGDISGQYKPHDLGVGAGGSVSREPDYLSIGGFVTVTKDFEEKNKTVTLGYGYSHDTAGRCGADGACTSFDVFARQLDRSALNVGYSWVIDAATLGTLSTDIVVENGDQSKPYRYIPMFSPSVAPTVAKGALIGFVNAFRLPERPLEQLPLELFRVALTGRIAHRFDGSTVRVDERLYTDDWGLVASTTDGRWILDLGHRIEVWPHVRFHAQSSVVFWKRAYISDPTSGWNLPEYRTGDRELGPLWTFDGGMGLRIYLGKSGRPEQFGLQLSWDGMYTSFLDDLYLTQRTAMLGALTFLGEL